MPQDPDRAFELWHEGTQRLLAGDLEEAIALFTRSLETHPTAEAYTFRGWAYSFAGDWTKPSSSAGRPSRPTPISATRTTTSGAT